MTDHPLDSHVSFRQQRLARLVVTAGADDLPSPYRTQLADGGQLVIPIGSVPTRQERYRFTRRGKNLTVQIFGDFACVPLVGNHAWKESVWE